MDRVLDILCRQVGVKGMPSSRKFIVTLDSFKYVDMPFFGCHAYSIQTMLRRTHPPTTHPPTTHPPSNIPVPCEEFEMEQIFLQSTPKSEQAGYVFVQKVHCCLAQQALPSGTSHSGHTINTLSITARAARSEHISLLEHSFV